MSRSPQTRSLPTRSARGRTSRSLVIGALAAVALGASAAPADATPVVPVLPTVARTARPAPPTRFPTTCRGMAAHVVPAFEEYVATMGDDVIVALPGTEVWAEFGNDTICAYSDGDHPATVHAGHGQDLVLGFGTNELNGDADADVIIANGGSALVDGGYGDDIINVGGAASSAVWGSDGHDIITGSPGIDTIYGNGGNDLVFGWDGDDHLYGDDGDDELVGGDGWDGHSGGVGADECRDVDSPVDGGMFGECEDVIVTPDGPDGLAFG